MNTRATAKISNHFQNLFRSPDLYRHCYLPVTEEAKDPQRCHTFDAELSEETRSAVRTCARQLRCTPYVVLLAGYFRALSRLTGQFDMAVVTPLARRTHPQTREMIADLINLVPHRVPDLDRLSDIDLVARLRYLVTEAARNQDDQFDQVIDALNLPFPEDRNALTGFSLNYMPQTAKATPSVRVHSDRGYKLKYDVLFLMRDFRNCLNVEIQYRSGLFDRAGIEAFFDLYATPLKEISRDTRSH
jgi:mycobactin peptide synthetase MbtE